MDFTQAERAVAALERIADSLSKIQGDVQQLQMQGAHNLNQRR